MIAFYYRMGISFSFCQIKWSIKRNVQSYLKTLSYITDDIVINTLDNNKVKFFDNTIGDKDKWGTK